MRSFRGQISLNMLSEPINYEFLTDDNATEAEIEAAAKEAAIEEVGLEWEWEEDE